MIFGDLAPPFEFRPPVGQETVSSCSSAVELSRLCCINRVLQPPNLENDRVVIDRATEYGISTKRGQSFSNGIKRVAVELIDEALANLKPTVKKQGRRDP